MKGIVIVRSGGEIGIKSKPVRRDYENLLLKLIRGSLNDQEIECTKMWRTAGRIYFETADIQGGAKIASKVFGVSSASPGYLTESNLDSIAKTGVSIASQTIPSGTFAVRCRRTGIHPFTSQQVAAKLGESILQSNSNLKVELENPEHEINVEIRDDMAIIYVENYRGADGYPIGTQEPVVGMLDETVDSAVASWCMMKRGSAVTAITLNRSASVLEATMQNLNKLSEWLPRKGLRCLVVDAPDSVKMDVSAARALNLQLAIHLALNENIGGVVTGMPVDDLKFLTCLTRQYPVCLVFPLIAIDELIFNKWAEMVGLKNALENRYGSALKEMIKYTESDMESMLSGAKEIIISKHRIA